MLESIARIEALEPLDADAEEDAGFRAKDRAWVALVRLFDQHQASEGLTYAQLGSRIKRSRAHVQRWLASPFNLSLKSLGLLAEGLNADLEINLYPRIDGVRTNYCHPAEDARAAIESLSVISSWKYRIEEKNGNHPMQRVLPSSSETAVVRSLIDA